MKNKAAKSDAKPKQGEFIGAFITPEMKAQLKAIAARNRRTVAMMIRFALEKLIAEEQAANGTQ